MLAQIMVKKLSHQNKVRDIDKKLTEQAQ